MLWRNESVVIASIVVPSLLGLLGLATLIVTGVPCSTRPARTGGR